MDPWRRSLGEQLRARDRRERDPFRGLFELHQRNLERLSELQSAQPVSSLSSVSSEEVSVLKRKVYELQEELTTAHRRKGDNAQQVLDLSARVRRAEEQLGERAAREAQAKQVSGRKNTLVFVLN